MLGTVIQDESKTPIQTFVDISANYSPIFKTCSLLPSAVNRAAIKDPKLSSGLFTFQQVGAPAH